MNEELRKYIEKYVEYFQMDCLLDQKEMTKEEVITVYENLEELDEECKAITPRVVELLKK